MGGASFYVGGSTIWDGGSLDGFSLVRNLCFAAVTVRRYMWSLGPRRKGEFQTDYGVRVTEPDLNPFVPAFWGQGATLRVVV